MSSQGENSTSLKAGNTKLKGSSKLSGIGANIRYLVNNLAKRGLVEPKVKSLGRKPLSRRWTQI
jgi:hypothetical protein